MTSPPRVSVVVPTHDRLPLLRETVASVLAQTFGDWELVVVDDGSSDGTAAWLAGLEDPRVRALALPHSGNLGRVRNRGIEAARGELIALLDSDDLFAPEKLEKQVAALDARPDCGWSYTTLALIDADGRPADGPPVPWRELSGWILPELLRFEAIVDSPTVMVRRALLERAGTLDEALDECQDYDLFFRLAAASPAVMVPEPLTLKRVHEGGLSRDRTRVNEAWIAVYERFGAGSADPEVRSICAEQARRHRLGSAVLRARRGETLPALAHVGAALARRPWSPGAWRVLVRDVLAPGLPGRRSRNARPGAR